MDYIRSRLEAEILIKKPSKLNKNKNNIRTFPPRKGLEEHWKIKRKIHI